jgi:sulfite dehydrogenase
MLTRRRLLEASGTSAVLAGLGHALAQSAGSEAETSGLDLSSQLPDGTRAEAVLDALPGKKPLIKLSYRPPNYETPIEYLRPPITTNDAFFVRYHMSDIPEVDADTWRLAIGGEGANREVSLSLDELKQLPAAEVVAVCQCSGNRRGLFEPHVAGVEWGYGAMGCGRTPERRARSSRPEVGGHRDRACGHRQGCDGEGTAIHQKHSGLEGDRGDDAPSPTR